MATFKFRFRPSTVWGNQGTLVLSVIHRRRCKVAATQLKLYPGEWDERQQRVVPDENERKEYLLAIQERIEQMHATMQQVILQLGPGERRCVEEYLEAYARQTKGVCLFPFIEEQAARLERAGQLKTATSYRCAANSLHRFLQGRDPALGEIDSALMQRYESWLRGRGVSRNTVSFYMRILRAVYNRAAEQGLTEQRRPFRSVFTGNEQTRKRAVDRKVILAMKGIDLSWSRPLCFARDMFLLSFYLRGMSFVDMAYLRKADVAGGLLRYRRRKTGQLMQIRLEPCMVRIIEHYAPLTASSPFLLPIIRADNPRSAHEQYLNAMHNHNMQLRRLSQLLGLPEKITSYCARHTWATIARRSEVPISVISEGMGHNSETTTRIYLASLDQSVLDRANRKVLAGL